MRLIKLSTSEFKTKEDIKEFFEKKLQIRTPAGLFLFPKGWISKNGLKCGEIILFSYQGTIVYIAKTLSERLNNIYLNQALYPNCFIVDIELLQSTNILLSELEQELKKEIHFKKSIVKAQGWVIIPESIKTEEIINKLVIKYRN